MDALQQFNIGDSVRIRKTSQFYNDGMLHNPPDTTGRVRRVSVQVFPLESDVIVIVDWPDARSAPYRVHDLEHVPPIILEITS
jgi:hypothetical protein